MADSRPAAPDAADEPTVSAGWIGKPHGLNGAVHVTRPRSALLRVGMTVTLAGTARRIVHRGGTDARPIVRFEGLDHISQVEPLRGTDIEVARSALPPLEEGEFWPEQLEGVTVRSTRGNVVGTIRQVLLLPSCDVLEVERPGTVDLLVPLHREAVPEFDVAAGRVVVDLDFLDEDEPTGKGDE